jgi:hypothetical protein
MDLLRMSERFQVFHCPSCGWRSDVARGIAMAPYCPDGCNERLLWITFSPDELAAVNRIIKRPIAESELG